MAENNIFHKDAIEISSYDAGRLDGTYARVVANTGRDGIEYSGMQGDASGRAVIPGQRSVEADSWDISHGIIVRLITISRSLCECGKNVYHIDTSSLGDLASRFRGSSVFSRKELPMSSSCQELAT